MERFIALDTETTGIDFCTSQVIQCGAVFLDDKNQPIERKEWNINFQKDKFTWDITSETIHGIPQYKAETHGVSPEVFLKEFEQKIMKHYTYDAIDTTHIIAANAHFDLLMLESLWKTYREGSLPLSHRVMDLSSMSLMVLSCAGLSRVAKILGIPTDKDKRHSALYDAEIHLKVFYALLTVAKEEGVDMIY